MNYSIGIVTYHARFDKYLVPLINKLVEVFPDKEIICIANGHPDQTLQIEYLKKFTSALKRHQNVRYLTYEDNQGLTKCWNRIIQMGDTNGYLMLNDDTQVSELFRREFEKKIVDQELPFSTINGSWSHYFLTRGIISEVGWFDENFKAIGQEDADYMFRMSIKGLPITNTLCLGITNYIAPADNPTWKQISAVTDGKYSSINKDYIKTKYATPESHPNISKFTHTLRWQDTQSVFTPLTSDLAPTKYSFTFLDNNPTTGRPSPKKVRLTVLILQTVWFTGIKTAKSIYRELVGLLR